MKWENSNLQDLSFKDYEEGKLTNLRFSDEDIDKVTIKFETLRQVSFINCKFQNVNFDNCFLGKVEFINCQFSNVNFSECNMSKVRFDNCKFTSFSVFACKIDEILIFESLMQYSKFENTEINIGKFDDVSFRDNIYRHCKYKGINYYKCDVYLDNYIDVVIRDSDFRTSHFREVKMNIDDLVGSRLSVLNLIELVAYKGVIVED